MKLNKLQVKTSNQTYPIVIGSGAVDRIAKLLEESLIHFNQCLIIADNKIPKKKIKKILKLLPKKK